MSKTRRDKSKATASDSVRREWLRRVEAEYRSAALTQHLVLWLMQLGASPDLLLSGLRIVRDELAHADLSHRVYVAAGGEGAPNIARESLELVVPSSSLEHRVARACVEVFCLGETVAVPLFRGLREGCSRPTARRALDRILRDEVRHRDFGWTLIEWLFTTPLEGRLRDEVARELPAMLARLSAGYAPEGAAQSSAISDEDRAWGLMAPASYARILERALARDFAPRFTRLGIDVLAAWRARDNPLRPKAAVEVP